MSQKAIVIDKPSQNPKVEIKEIPIPEPGPNDLLVRLYYTGVW